MTRLSLLRATVCRAVFIALCAGGAVSPLAALGEQSHATGNEWEFRTTAAPLAILLDPVVLKDGWPQRVEGFTRSSPVWVELGAGPSAAIFLGVFDRAPGQGSVYGWKADGTPAFGSSPIVFQAQNRIISSPAAADLEGDGRREIVFGADDGFLYVLTVTESGLRKPASAVISKIALPKVEGREPPPFDPEDRDFPFGESPGKSTPLGDKVYASPALGQLDEDPELEIAIGAENGLLYALNANGSLVAEGWPVALGGIIRSSPAVGDMNGDGENEVVIGCFDGNVYAFSREGRPLPGWPVATGGTITSSPCLADIDGDGGTLEAVIGSSDGFLYALDFLGGAVPGVWPVRVASGTGELPNDVDSSPAVGDLDGDGEYEIVVGSDGGFLHAFDSSGEYLPGWPIETGGEVFSSAALGDIDGDGFSEIFIGSDVGSLEGERWSILFGLRKDGTPVEGFPMAFPIEEYGETRLRSSPMLKDLDGDGFVEIAAALYLLGEGAGELRVYSSHRASRLAPWPLFRQERRRAAVAPTPVCFAVPEGIAGDVDLSGDVGRGDVFYFGSHWASGAASDRYRSALDLNGDEGIDEEDLLLLLADWKREAGNREGSPDGVLRILIVGGGRIYERERFRDLLEEVESLGFLPLHMPEESRRLSDLDLSIYRAVWLMDNRRPLGAEEIAALDGFVLSGGNVLSTEDPVEEGEPADNGFLSGYGIGYERQPRAGLYDTDELTNHFITEGVSEVRADGYLPIAGGSGEAGADLMRVDGERVLWVEEVGSGRLAVLGDEDMVSDALIPAASNRRFVQNLFGYLSLPPLTPTPTDTPTATSTATSTSTATNTATSTPTDTPTATPTDTPTATNTSTATNTATSTPTPTDTPTFTPTFTRTSTATSTNTPTFTPTFTPTHTPTPVRVTEGLVVFYPFEEGTGTVVGDRSGYGDPLDLEILDPSRILWLTEPKGVEFTAPGSAVQSPSWAKKIHNAAVATNQISLEAWVSPSSVAQSGPARIVTFSSGSRPGEVNMQLAQGGADGSDGSSASFLLRTTDNRTSRLEVPGVFTDTMEPHHIVAVWDGSAKRIYVDGGARTPTEALGGSLSNWNSTWPLTLGNEATLDRSWLGRIHLVAIYDHALTESEVLQNFRVGPRAVYSAGKGGRPAPSR